MRLFGRHGPVRAEGKAPPGQSRAAVPAQQAECACIGETGPDPSAEGVMRGRHVDLRRVIEERIGVAYHARTVGKLLAAPGGLSHSSAPPPGPATRPCHPGQDGEAIQAFKKTSRARLLPTLRGG